MQFGQSRGFPINLIPNTTKGIENNKAVRDAANHPSNTSEASSSTRPKKTRNNPLLFHVLLYVIPQIWHGTLLMVPRCGAWW